MGQLDFSGVRINGPLPGPESIDVRQMVEELWPAYVETVMPHLTDLEAAAMALEAGHNAEAQCASIRRLLHSVKGDSGMAGLNDIYRLCHEAESAFAELSDQADKADMVLRVKDWIEAAINYLQKSDRQQLCRRDPDQPRDDQPKLKTLVIDDDRVCRRRILALLNGFCECTMARDGRSGIELFRQALEAGEPFRLVTLDIQMPYMDGHEALAAIRRIERQHGIDGLDGCKVIMTTSHGESQHVFGAFRGGCEAYVIKSELAEKLLEEMAKLGLLKVTPSYSLG